MLCTQYRYIQCYVKRVERLLCIQHRYIQCYVKRVERLHYVHNIDTFNAMSKGLKDYVMLKQGIYTSLLITFLNIQPIFNPKKLWKAET